jgi:hypothetical protein
VWNKFVAGLFYALSVNYVLHSLYLHSGPLEMLTETLSREELYTLLGAGSLVLAILAETMISSEDFRR